MNDEIKIENETIDVTKDTTVGFEVGNICYTTWFGASKGEPVRIVNIENNNDYLHGKGFVVQRLGKPDVFARVAQTWLSLRAEA